MNTEPKLITLALRDFAVPSPRTGSIEAHSGYGRASLEGQEIHRRTQKKRVKADPSYEPEVPVQSSFDRAGYRFRIDGRMDGIFRTDPPKIEEIKTAFNIHELARRLSGDPMDHPYCLQLLTYGYFYWLEHRVVPALSFHLVSTRSRDSRDLELTLDIPVYEQWLESRLDELVIDAGRRRSGRQGGERLPAISSFPLRIPAPARSS